MRQAFTHLHACSAYSFKYGTTKPRDLVARASEYEMPALALTDRDGLAGAIRFAQSCVEYGIAPIIGIDLAINIGKTDGRKSLPRVTLLAHSDGGWRSLCRLLTSLHTYKSSSSTLDRITTPTLTFDFLERFSEYSRNLLLLHGPESPVGAAITLRRHDLAFERFSAMKELFLGHAIECVSHLVAGDGPRSTAHAARSLIFARDYKIPAVITNAVRMREKIDGPVADVLDSARQLVPLHSRHVERKNAEAYLKSSDEMFAVAEEITKAAGERTPRELLATTREWAERAVLDPKRDIGLGGIHLPEPHIVGAESFGQMQLLLRKRSEAGVNWRYSNSEMIAQAHQRLEDELETVSILGYESYFLTVADITDMTRERGIRVAARGSSAGSLICHLLGISDVDPIQNDLLTERFCSPLRRALPDIDIDVESERRLEVYDLVFKRYGDANWSQPGNTSRCATVAMVDTYRARHAIRDTGTAIGLPFVEIDLIAKSMPHISARNISRALENLPELKGLNLTNPLAAMTISLAERLDGLPRHLAMHPCAVVLSDGGFLDRAPLQVNASGYPMVEFDKDDVEAIGLLKLDILGVRMQSTLAYAIQEIERVEEKKVDIDAIPLNDEATFDLICSTRTLGVFQVESPGQRELVGRFAPKTFMDLIIDISLFRPGPVKSDMIRPFLNARHGWNPAQIIHPDLYEVLHETEGVVVFQEQVISIISIMAGVSLAEADEKRRELDTREGQQEVCDWFYPTVLNRGYDLATVTAVWNVLRAFASFGFCKAHAAAFALPTYQSAWLKAHHPAAFIAGVLTYDPGMYPKRLILDDARQMGIVIAPIDVNRSGASYFVERVNSEKARIPASTFNGMSTGPSLRLPDARGYAIRMSLSDVSGISQGEIESIIAGQPYLDLADFHSRSGASYPTTEKLILVGAFDDLHAMSESEINRRDLLLHLSDLHRSPVRSLGGAQLNFGFTPPALISSGLPDLDAYEKVRHEMDHLGMDVSHHLLEFYAEFLNEIGAVRSSDLLAQRSGTSVLVAGVKVALQTPPVRSGRRVIFLTLDDGYGCNDATFFFDAQKDYASVLFKSRVLLVQGEVRRTGPRGVSIRATGAWNLHAAYEEHTLKRSTLVI
ncbi:MAG: DNA polymerase III subunit alpha [Actinomycetota bacterium]